MKNIAIICPCFNEEEIIKTFLNLLIAEISVLSSFNFSIIIVDDGSSDSTVEVINSYQVVAKNVQIDLYKLEINQGHQRAIYQGLNYISDNPNIDKAIVMDCDGEDNPAVIKEMLQCEEADVIQITRGKRNEGIIFRISYFFYKKFTSIIIGKAINYGNYSMISMKIVQSITQSGFIHYPAHISKYKAVTIESDRMKRIGGKPKMNFDNLLYHGLLALAEYSEKVIIFLFKMVFGFAIVVTVMIGTVLYLKFTNQATPGWASNLVVSMFNSLLISFGFLLMGLLLMKSRQS